MQSEFNDAREAEQQLEANRRHAEEMQLHRAKVGSVKRPVAWRKLRERIQGVIGVDRALFVSRPNVASKMTVAPDGNGFVLDHAAYPKARTRVAFQPPLIQIQCSYQKTDDSDSVEW